MTNMLALQCFSRLSTAENGKRGMAASTLQQVGLGIVASKLRKTP